MPKRGVVSEKYRAAVGTYTVEATRAARVEGRFIITDVSGAKILELNQVGLKHLREILQEVEEFLDPVEATKSVDSTVSSASDDDGSVEENAEYLLGRRNPPPPRALNDPR